MKRIPYFLVSLLLVATLLLASAPKSVSASAGDIGSGNWVLPNSSAPFTTVNVDTDAKTAPNWYQQLSEGVVITAPTKICYPFRGGQYHWVPQIMQLTDGKWSKIATTKEYLNNDDGMLYYACSAAPAAGTYALFGYYNGPKEEAGTECKFSFEGQYRDFGDIDDNYTDQTFGLLFILPSKFTKNGDPASYSIYNVTPSGAIISGLTGSTKISFNDAIFGPISYHTTDETHLGFNVRLDLPAEHCYKIVYIEMSLTGGGD